MTEPTPHILIVDDDREIRDLLSRFLAKNGFRASLAANGREMRRALADAKIDLIVLDIMMPGETGLQLCAALRAQEASAARHIPIIMLTAVGEEMDRILGLEMGADDYLPKPFSPRELLARIRAVLRRGRAQSDAPAGDEILQFVGWRLEAGTRRLFDPAGREVALSSGEFDLLLTLARRPQRVLSREQLLDLTKGRAAQLFDRSIDVQIGRLRRRVEPDPAQPRLIVTVRGGGYMLAAPATKV